MLVASLIDRVSSRHMSWDLFLKADNGNATCSIIIKCLWLLTNQSASKFVLSMGLSLCK